MKKLTIFGAILFAVFLPAWAGPLGFQASAIPDNPYAEAQDDRHERHERLVNELARGWVKAISAETTHWYECGKETPREEWLPRAEKMARSMLDAMREYDLNVSPWGIWGTIYKESLGNRCAIGPRPRKVAYTKSLIEMKHVNLWTEEEVLGVINHTKWRDNLADLGFGQVVWRKFALIKDPDGRVRTPTAEEMISQDAGMKVTVYGMKDRTSWAWDKKTRSRPWLFWPGRAAYTSYEMSVARIVQRMGASQKALFR